MSFQGWIGQALLAETAGFDEEAMDLFRHCTFLGNGLESASGYAHWICKTLSQMAAKDQGIGGDTNKHSRYCIEKMYGVTVAIDSLTHYVERVPNDPCGLNMLGILLERQKHFRSAKKVLTKALKQAQNCAQLQDQILANLGRVLGHLEEYEASIKCYKKVTSPDFYVQVGLALNSWRAEKFQEAYQAYGTALQMAQNSEERSHILTAMATIAYKFQVIS